MDATEIEAALEELEQRVERLRALYEQYFLGIEKIEPAVLRKDVERRFWILRRTQIRNTAMRFKLNTVNQRYNTYQQYWQRSVREIEAGTYRRHVLRAEKRFGQDALTITARKRFAKAGPESTEAMDEREERARRALEQVTDLDSFDDIDFGDPDVFSLPRAPVQSPVVAAHGLDELDDLESLMGLDAGPTVSGVPRSVPPGSRTSKPGPRPPVPSRTPPPGPPKAEDDFGDIGGLFAEDGNDRTAPHVRLPFSTPPAPRPAPGAPRPSAAPQRPSQPLPPPKLPPLPVPPPQRSSSPQVPQRPSQPQSPYVPPPVAPPRPPQASGQRPLPPRAAPQRPSQPQPPLQPQRPPQPQPQPPERPSQPQRPPPPQPAQRTPQGSPPASGLSDDRVREIYRDYVNAKRQCNESTSAITEASLAKSLRGSADKLSQKHKGRRIDYEVVIKDGRAVLKPVVKS